MWEPSWTWKQVLTFRATWLLLLGRLITDPAWYFYQFWFPKYLHSERGLSQEQLKITWIVYAAAGVGSILGGWLSGRLIQRGSAPAASRMWIMLGCACLMPVSFLISRVEGVNTAMALTILVVIGRAGVVDQSQRYCGGRGAEAFGRHGVQRGRRRQHGRRHYHEHVGGDARFRSILKARRVPGSNSKHSFWSAAPSRPGQRIRAVVPDHGVSLSARLADVVAGRCATSGSIRNNQSLLICAPGFGTASCSRSCWSAARRKAEVRLPALISDGMVLQRGEKVRIGAGPTRARTWRSQLPGAAQSSGLTRMADGLRF